MSGFTHFDEEGRARMVDVGRKPVTSRTAVARGSITMSAVAFRSIAHGKVAKGDVLNIARIAGIMAAKKTPDLIPLCHPLSISSVTVDFDLDESSNTIVIESQVTVSGRTGVEMEALTAVSVAALTIYDMCKAIDKRMVISQIALVFKKGGKSGDFQR